MATGVDYSSGHPGGAALKAAGKAFACRYVSHTAAKNITAAEAKDLAAHGVWTVLVWETTDNRAGAGRAAGIADAKDALAQATAAGMPPGRPLYFAVDWDANPTVVVPYFQGVASVLGLARTGAYGGYKVISYLLDHKLAAWAWQTAAWSGGRWDARAHIRQPATGVRINGVACDNDTSTQADFGQWMPGITPLEDDMQLTDAVTLPAQARALWPTDKGVADGKVAVNTALGSGYVHARRARENTDVLLGRVDALAQTVAGQTAAIAALAAKVGSGEDTAAIVAAVEQAIAAAVVHVTVTTDPPASA